MFRILFAATICCLAAMPAMAQQYLTQTQLESLLQRSGSSPQALGMKKVRVCELRGKAVTDGHFLTYGRKAATESNQRMLVKRANTLNQERPAWFWEAHCTAEWQLMSALLVRKLEPTMILVASPKVASKVNSSATVAATTVSIKSPKSSAVRLTHNGKWDEFTEKTKKQILNCEVYYNNKPITACVGKY